jgi:hypothetical protein
MIVLFTAAQQLNYFRELDENLPKNSQAIAEKLIEAI